MEPESPSNDTTGGNLVLRFRYPDGRLTGVITLGNDWRVETFANEDAARAFAKEHGLTIKEMEQ